MIGVIDYGLSNIRSIVNKLHRLSFESKVVSRPNDLQGCTKLILPGVGHFAKGMSNLRERGLQSALSEAVLEKKAPILGICLGMQLMTSFSEEGEVEGLGWVRARTLKLPAPSDRRYRVPHVGWSAVNLRSKSQTLFDGLESLRFYFTHSFAVTLDDPTNSLAQADYIRVFDAAFQCANIYGTQFHPEKSHRQGQLLLQNFVAKVPECRPL